MKRKFIFFASAFFAIYACLSGCAHGPKLYNNVSHVIISDKALLSPPMIVKEFMPIIPERLKEYTEAEVAVQGDLKVVPTCGPKTLKMTQDIESISVGGKADMSFNIFRSSATASKSDDIRISINAFITDCESGKKLVSFSYQNKGQDIIVILKELAKYNVQYLYDCQYGPRLK